MAEMMKMKCPACGATLTMDDYVEGRCSYCDTVIKYSPVGISEGISHVINTIGNQIERQQDKQEEIREKKVEEQKQAQQDFPFWKFGLEMGSIVLGAILLMKLVQILF